MSEDILGYLLGKGLNMKKAGGQEFHCNCFFHGEEGNKGRLYINCDSEADIPGLYFCHVCGEKGALSSIRRFFGDQITEHEIDADRRREILTVAADYYAAELTKNDPVLEYLTGDERGLLPETVESRNLGYAAMELSMEIGGTARRERSKALYFHLRRLDYEVKEILATGLVVDKDGDITDSLQNMITIPYHVAGHVVQIRGRAWPYTQESKDKGYPKYKTCGGNQARLYNTDTCWNQTEVILTEGEFDAMVIEQLSSDFHAIGSPGARTWQDQWNDTVAPLKRMYICFDRDAAGDAGAQSIVDRFGARMRRVHLSPEGVKIDPTQWVQQGHTAADLVEIIAAAGRNGMLIGVREAMEAHAEIQDLPGIKFNDRMLDLSIDPGLQPSQVMVILAKTGTGKTIMALNWMHRIITHPDQLDHKVLFISLEQTRGEWWERARRIAKFYDPTRSDEDVFKMWNDRIMIVDKNRLNEDEFGQCIDDFEYQQGKKPDLVVVDYLGYWARSFRGEAYERTSEAIMSLKAMGKDHLVPIITPHQVNRSGHDGEEFGAEAARDSGVVEETADFLLTMWTPDNTLGRNPEEMTGNIKLRIGKSRHGGRNRLLEYQFAPLSLAMLPVDGTETLGARARKEVSWKIEGDNYKQVLYRHRYGIEGVLPLDPFAAGAPPVQQTTHDPDDF